MSANAEHPMIMATNRLVSALDALEQKLQQVSVEKDRDVVQQKQLVSFSRENESLKAERDKLNSAIASLTQQYSDLQTAATNIHGKLDESIKRISQIIEA